MSDHFYANFAGGASSLVAYTPDTGAALSSPSGQSEFFTWNWYGEPGFNPMDDAWFKDGAGAAYFNDGGTNTWGGNSYLQVNTNAPTVDYYIEAEIEFASAGANDNVSVALGVRVSPNPTPPGTSEVGNIGCAFHLDRGTPAAGTTRVQSYFDYNFSDADWSGSPACNIVNGSVVNTDVATLTTIKIRLEVEALELRAFVNDALVLSSAFTASSTAILTAKKAFIAFWPFSNVTSWKINYIKAGDAFLAPPPGAFWQDFVKTVEA